MNKKVGKKIKRKVKKKQNLKKLVNVQMMQLLMILLLLIFIAIIIIVARKISVNLDIGKADANQSEMEQNNVDNSMNQNGTGDLSNTIEVSNNIDIVEDWQIRLVNRENPLPDDFTVELEDLDSYRKFDKRAIEPLKQMIYDMRNQGISNIWAQSTYRSIDYQKRLYEKSINKYLKQGKTQEEAEKLTDEYINRPGTSEHHLGLAVDFNNVEEGFENTKAYKWLLENASNYGFILRYPKEKEDITGIEYEPWHWRYVGSEHAKKIKEQNLCLEEYVLGASLI